MTVAEQIREYLLRRRLPTPGWFIAFELGMNADQVYAWLRDVPGIERNKAGLWKLKTK